MVTLLRTSAVALAAALATTAVGISTGSVASAADPVFTVNVGAKGSWTKPDDTPAGMYLDKDGTFWFQQAHALYGPTDGRSWSFFSGTNIDTATKSSISTYVNPANLNDKNGDTTWRCNNSPTGLESTSAPAGSGYSQRNYCDLAGVWVDPDTGNWHGLVHNEFIPQPFGDGLHYDSIDNAVPPTRARRGPSRNTSSPRPTARPEATPRPSRNRPTTTATGTRGSSSTPPRATSTSTTDRASSTRVAAGRPSTHTSPGPPSPASWRRARGRSGTAVHGPKRVWAVWRATSCP